MQVWIQTNVWLTKANLMNETHKHRQLFKDLPLMSLLDSFPFKFDELWWLGNVKFNDFLKSEIFIKQLI